MWFEELGMLWLLSNRPDPPRALLSVLWAVGRWYEDSVFSDLPVCVMLYAGSWSFLALMRGKPEHCDLTATTLIVSNYDFDSWSVPSNQKNFLRCIDSNVKPVMYLNSDGTLEFLIRTEFLFLFFIMPRYYFLRAWSLLSAKSQMSFLSSLLTFRCCEPTVPFRRPIIRILLDWTLLSLPFYWAILRAQLCCQSFSFSRLSSLLSRKSKHLIG